MMEEEVARLHAELADVKRLLTELLGQKQAVAAAAAQQQEPEAAGHGDHARHHVAAYGLKASVHLDLPSEEQQQPQHLHSSDASGQHQQVAPLRIGLKPSIQEAVLLQRAVHAAQQASDHHDGPAAPAGQIHHEGSAGQPQESSTCRPESGSGCDAAVHVITAAGGGKDASAHGRVTATGECREVDMLAKRVHANMDASDEQGQMQAQPEALPASRPAAACRLLALVRAVFLDVIMPSSYFALAWDLIMLLVLVYLCIALPYTVAFAIDFADLRSPLSQVDITFSVLFMIDCCLNFRTAYISDDGTVEMRHSRIAWRYMRGWFLFDVLSSLPWEQMISQNSHIPTTSIVALLKIPRVLRVVKVLRLLKVLRMARLTNLPAVMSKVDGLTNRPMVQLGTQCAMVCMLLHWIACVWYWIATIGSDGGWVSASGLAAEADSHKYVAALYFAVSTVATVGFGDITAVTLREKVVATITMLIGATIFGYMLSSISVMVSAASSTRARMAAKRRGVDDFLTHRKVPRALSEKVKAYYDYVVEREVQADEADIIQGLSASLRTQIVLHLYAEALEKVPFFRGQHPQFITSIVTALQLEFYAPGDIVVRQGDMGDAMYFLAQGSLEVRLYEDSDNGSSQTDTQYEAGGSRACTPLAADQLQQPACRTRRAVTYEDELTGRPYRHLGYLHCGEYFGEHSCLLGQERSASVVASSYVELYSLSRADLELVLQQWPELAEQFEAMVQEAAGSLFPDQHACSPLARWNVVKAACVQQQANSTPTTAAAGTTPAQHTASSGLQAEEHGSTASPQAAGKAAERSAPSSPHQLRVLSNISSGAGGPPALKTASRSSSRGSFLGRGSFFGGLFGGSAGSRDAPVSPISPQFRSSLAGQSGLQHARSDPIAINAVLGGSRRLQDKPGPQQHQQQLARVSLATASTTFSDAAVFDFPSLSIGNMSGLSPPSMSAPSGIAQAVPPAAAGRAHRRSGSLTRCSLPPMSRTSISAAGGSVSATGVAQPSLARGSGLFRTNSVQR